MKLEQASAAVQKAIQAATSHGVNVVAVVVDTGGHPVVIHRMTGASFVNTEVATRKATLAAAFGTPTQQIATMVGKDPIAAPVLQADTRLCMLPGGVPLMDGGACVGALGIAGAHYMQDQAIADFAVSV